MTVWAKRPPSNSPGGRAAYDLLVERHAPLKIVELWYAPEMYAWCAKFDDGQYHEVDILIVSQTRHKAKLETMLARGENK